MIAEVCGRSELARQALHALVLSPLPDLRLVQANQIAGETMQSLPC